jgi:multicomponent Na+:H+ antiporter subunit E
MKRVTLFVLAFVVWVLLTWPFGPAGAVSGQDLVAGGVVALIVALVTRRVQGHDWPRLCNPLRYFWMAVYAVVFVYYMVRANLDVAYRVIHPALPIAPGIVRVKTRLKSPLAITALANSITLTPGTMTVSVDEQGVLYIHWINVRSTDVEEATREIVAPFEWFLKRILE